MKHIKLIHCPALNKGIKENEIADNQKQHLKKLLIFLQEQTYLYLKVMEINRQITLDKWHRRWENISVLYYKSAEVYAD